MKRTRIVTAVIEASSKVEKRNKRVKIEFEETLKFLNFKSYTGQSQFV